MHPLKFELWLTSWSGFSSQEPVEKLVGIMWKIFEPILFGLIGAEVAISDLDPKTIGKHMAHHRKLLTLKRVASPNVQALLSRRALWMSRNILKKSDFSCRRKTGVPREKPEEASLDRKRNGHTKLKQNWNRTRAQWSTTRKKYH